MAPFILIFYQLITMKFYPQHINLNNLKTTYMDFDSDIICLIVQNNYPLNLFTVEKGSSHLNTEVCVSTGYFLSCTKISEEFEWYLIIFYSFKNKIINNCIIKEKRRQAMLVESLCIWPSVQTFVFTIGQYKWYPSDGFVSLCVLYLL